MTLRYGKNRLYINDSNQETIKKIPVLLGGSGLGSVIAECALRLGFETITIVDGDIVESSNLNRQNYTETDIGQTKATSIEKRLKAINPGANITCHNCFLTEDNAEKLIHGHQLAINALDFATPVPLLFDKICHQKGIPVLHPYNLGWAGLLTVIMPDGVLLETIARENERFNELTMVEYASGYLKFWNQPQPWIDEIIKAYKEEKTQFPPPQLSVASWLVASMCTHVMYDIATGKSIKRFPEFYLLSLMGQ